jgi:RNA polymerase sigma factor (sigma-70 family)
MPTRPAGLIPALRRVVLASAADRSDGQLLGAFVADRDGDAFAALVRRHGPMVLGVCRRVVRDRAAADDAFQAVFLVLARRAAGVRPRERVGNWLYGVAHRTALKARAVLARRRSREKQVDPMPEPAAPDVRGPASPGDWADLRPVIDEELARLPEKFRTPVVLCDLEGRPQREVARQLGLPPATLATRLAAARRTLAQRLTRRGVALSGGAVAALLTAHGTAGAVPPAAVHTLVRAVEAVAAGGAVLPGVSAAAVQLSEGVIRMMLLTKLKAVAVVALTAAALSGGLGLGLVPAVAAGDDPAPARAVKVMPAPRPPAADPPGPPPGPVDDVTFLKRLVLDLRGTPATDIETLLFAADGDGNKRAKVTDWLLDDIGGGPAARWARLRLAQDTSGRARGEVLVLKDEPRDRVKAVAFTPDGKQVVVEGTVDFDVVAGRVADFIEVFDPVGPRSFNFTVADKDAKPGDVLYWFEAAADPKNPQVVKLLSDGAVRVWDAADGKAARADVLYSLVRRDRSASMAESDLDFLKRVTTAARGTPPTALEEKYFAEDKDPKKREKLVDLLLKEPAVAKKLGDDFKKRVLAAPGAFDYEGALQYFYLPKAADDYRRAVPLDPKVVDRYFKVELVPGAKPVPPTPAKQPDVLLPKVVPNPPGPPQPAADPFAKLIDELLAARKSDAEVLEALTLVTAGRLPTDAEKRLALGLVAKANDRKAAWAEVAKAMAGDGKKDVLRKVAPPPVPPAK